jgi:hypothetical protein
MAESAHGWWLIRLCGCVIGAILLTTQRAEAVGWPGEPEAEECRIGEISQIWVDNHSVFDLSQTDQERRFSWAFRLVNRLHIRTREEVILRELVFEVGDCYEPEILRESERVLRATGIIADVDIYGIRQPDGTVHVVVDTRDEWTTRVEAQAEPGSGLRLSGISVREDNLLGSGRRAAAFYVRSDEQTVYGMSYLDPQFLASRWQVGLAGGRTPAGGMFSQSLDLPFIGETGRRAVRQRLEHHDRNFSYLVRDEGRLIRVHIPESRRAFEVGGAIRVGERGRLTMLGLLVSGEWITYPGHAELEGEDGIPAPDSLVAPITARLDSIAAVRTRLVLGQRNVYYVRRRSLDSVNATEDVRLGAEVELGIGRTLNAFSTHEDLELMLGLVGGGALGSRALGGARFVFEGKRDYRAGPDEPEWQDVFGQMEIWGYWQPRMASRHTLVAAVSAAGGWNSRIPFQLTIGGATGLRGYPFHVAPGGSRVIGSLEARSFLGWPHPHLFDLGSTVFLDIGRTWAGQVPFGTDSPIHANLGVGLRAAFPPGSYNTFRFDVAAPITGGLRPGDLVFSLGTGYTVGRQTRIDREMLRSTRRGTRVSPFLERAHRAP